jgi:hypothetical protein
MRAFLITLVLAVAFTAAAEAQQTVKRCRCVGGYSLDKRTGKWVYNQCHFFICK